VRSNLFLHEIEMAPVRGPLPPEGREAALIFFILSNFAHFLLVIFVSWEWLNRWGGRLGSCLCPFFYDGYCSAKRRPGKPSMSCIDQRLSNLARFLYSC
jgi:hypothetical protein